MGLAVGVVGGRDFNNISLLYISLDTLRKQKDIDTIVSGGAKGADELAYRYAIDRGITFVCYPPVPEESFPTAYFKRNERIAEHCDVLVAFPTESSKGTYHTIKVAKKLGRKVLVWD